MNTITYNDAWSKAGALCDEIIRCIDDNVREKSVSPDDYVNVISKVKENCLGIFKLGLSVAAVNIDAPCFTEEHNQ